MIDKNDTQKKYEEWYKENAERVFGQSELWKKIQREKELDKVEKEEKTREIEFKERHDLFRNIDQQAKVWIQRYLSLSGIQRNQYSQIIDTYKRLSMSQIRGILREVHGFNNVSEEMIGKYKRFLIKEGFLKTDEEFEKERPSEEELRRIRQEGARSQAIALSKEKSHLDSEELEDILEHRKEGKEELTQNRIKELGEKQGRGLCLTDSEEEELEESEGKEEED